MQVAIAIALLLTCAFGVIAPYVARRITPSAATWMLTVGGLLAAISGIGVVALLGVTVVGLNQELAEYGHWSIAVFRRDDPVARPIASAALVIFASLCIRAVVTMARRVRSLRVAYRTCNDLHEYGGFVVLADSSVDAYALPGRPGRIVVTRGMLQVLDVDERRALLAHERAHLQHRHHWHVTAAVVAAAVNPLLARLPAAMSFSIERWADEDAARAVPRAVAARALARAAIAKPGPASRPAASLAAATVAVAARISALQTRPMRPRPVLLACTVGMVVIAVIAMVIAAEQTAELFTAAMSAHGPSPD
jgi:Zn-dependent protease with chaperone function